MRHPREARFEVLRQQLTAAHSALALSTMDAPSPTLSPAPAPAADEAPAEPGPLPALLRRGSVSPFASPAALPAAVPLDADGSDLLLLLLLWMGFSSMRRAEQETMSGKSAVMPNTTLCGGGGQDGVGRCCCCRLCKRRVLACWVGGQASQARPKTNSAWACMGHAAEDS